MNYVAGLVIDNDETLVIKKNKPEWQRNRFNLPGGAIEEGETAFEAMVREYKEETGLEITDWKHFCTLQIPDRCEIYFYSCYADIDDFSSPTDEKVYRMSLQDLYNLAQLTVAIPNLAWLINMGINAIDGHDNAVYTIIEDE